MDIDYSKMRTVIQYDNDGRKVERHIYIDETRKCGACFFFRREQLGKLYARCLQYPKKWWKAGWRACIVFKPKEGGKE